MEGCGDNAVADGRAYPRTSDEVACAIDPLFFFGRSEIWKNLLTPEHGLEINIRRPDAMHTMFIWKMPIVDNDLFFT